MPASYSRRHGGGITWQVIDGMTGTGEDATDP
jgi:hypothetical protein